MEVKKQEEKLFWENYWDNKIGYYKKHKEIFEIGNRWGYFCNEELHCHYRSIVRDFKNLSIIECGAGSGYVNCLMAKEGANATILDFSPKSIEYAEIVADRMGVKEKTKFICKDILSLGKDKIFDVAWNCGVMEHYSDEEAISIIGKMAGLVKRGGRIMITIPNLSSPEWKYRMIKKLIRSEKISERYITRDHLKKIMELSGITEVKIINVNYFLPSFLPSQLANFARRLQIANSINTLPWLFTGTGMVKYE